MLRKHIISLNFTDETATSNIFLGLKLERRKIRWIRLETHCYSSADGHPLHKLYHFHQENTSEIHLEGAQWGSERDWCKQGEIGPGMWGSLQILQREEIEIKNKTWGPGRKIHCQAEKRVIAWPAKDLIQHKISSTRFLICRSLRSRSLITLPCGFLFELWLSHQVVRIFPQTTLDGSPKLSQVPQRAGVISVWALEKGLQGQIQVQTQIHEDVITCELDGPRLPTTEARASSAHKDSGTSGAGAFRPGWLNWQRLWLSCQGWQWHFAHCHHPHQLHRKGTQELYSSPGLYSSNMRPGTASLAWSISAGSKHLCAGN